MIPYSSNFWRVIAVLRFAVGGRKIGGGLYVYSSILGRGLGGFTVLGICG